jgi:nucleoside-diphosphate-sugar epimerase
MMAACEDVLGRRSGIIVIFRQQNDSKASYTNNNLEVSPVTIVFIGGTGVISSACSQLVCEAGFDLYLLNRGRSRRPTPEAATILTADIQDLTSARRVLAQQTFDVVVDWIAFTPEHIERDLDLFRDRTRQYIFISSASAYQTPPSTLPITESTPLSNPYWSYSRAKIACEERLLEAYRRDNFPITIVRPSHTYDQTLLPTHGGYTVVHRMRQGKPVIVHGDGTSLWTLTHHADFARGFIGLLGNNQALGHAFHITSDEVLTWNQVFEYVAQAAGAQARLIHVPSDLIAAYDREWGASLLGDKAHSMVFDNSKIKRLVPGYQATIPFAQGVKETIEWFDADPARRGVNDQKDGLMDTIIAAYQAAFPE